MNELAQLKLSLARLFSEAIPTSGSWENPSAVKKLHEIGTDPLPPPPPLPSIAEVVEQYRHLRHITTFRNLKCLCYGVSMRLKDDWSILSDNALLDALLNEVTGLAKIRQKVICFQGLLSGYFAFSRFDKLQLEKATAGWKILRNWLEQQRKQLQDQNIHSDWFVLLTEHKNLLTSQPCQRYASDMLRGNNAQLEEVRKGLGIPLDSWMMEAVLLAQIRSAAELGDDGFQENLAMLLKLVQGQTEIKVSELLKLRAMAILLSRYARCNSTPEHPILRDAAVSIIGNPWLKRTAWDASVKLPSGQPDEKAREMINGWLTRRLISDFFELLSEDSRVDQRRLKYWLRFVHEIEGTPWLALGPNAWNNQSKPYRDLRERAKGCLLRLENAGDSSNNAFIMKIGEQLIVEFGMTGNACYVYPATPIPFRLGGGVISLNDLKNKKLGEALRHHDGRIKWESQFDQKIRRSTPFRPAVKSYPPSSLEHTPDVNWSANTQFAAVKLEADKQHIETKDQRATGGAFWVLTLKGTHPRFDENLAKWGFQYKENKGWWKE